MPNPSFHIPRNSALETQDEAKIRALGESFKSCYEMIEGLRLHYIIGGEGPPLLLIPGWPQTWYIWRYILPTLAKKYRVIAVELRGMGYSTRPENGYDTGTMAKDLQQLMHKIGISKYGVIGHDIGMWVAYALAADYPNEVSSLTVLEANLPGIGVNPSLFMEPYKNMRRWHFMFNQLPDLPEALLTGREEIYFKWRFHYNAHKPDRVAMSEYIQSYSAPGAMRAGFNCYRAFPETIAQNEERAKKKLSIPVLALGGEFSNGWLPKETMDAVAESVKGGVIADCGHYIPEESPEELLAWLIPFLENRLNS